MSSKSHSTFEKEPFGHMPQPEVYILVVEKKKDRIELPPFVILAERLVWAEEHGTCLEFRCYEIFEYGTNGKGFTGTYNAGYNQSGNFVSLSSTAISINSSGYVGCDCPVGYKISTYFMDQVVTWVKQWPDAEVNTINLLICQATDNNRKNRRNKFWENFNIKFDWKDPGHKGGSSIPMKVKDLKNYRKWECNGQLKPDTLLDGLAIKIPLKLQRGLIAQC